MAPRSMTSEERRKGETEKKRRPRTESSAKRTHKGCPCFQPFPSCYCCCFGHGTLGCQRKEGNNCQESFSASVSSSEFDKSYRGLASPRLHVQTANLGKSMCRLLLHIFEKSVRGLVNKSGTTANSTILGSKVSRHVSERGGR